MNRRKFLRFAAGATSLGLAGCTGDAVKKGSGDGELAASSKELGDLPEIKWDMPTSWPANLETIQGGAIVFAEEVGKLTGGRFKITVHESGKLIPGLEVLQNVESGAYNIGHSAGYHYTGKAELAAFGAGMPFGLNARQQNAWLYEGGGLEMLQNAYIKRFGVINFPCGNTGGQMGGWFNKELRSAEDLKGLKMRIPGLGGRVMNRLGVAVQQIPGGEIYQALQTGAIDATEWVGPHDDLTLGFPEVAKFYYYPGWHETGTTLEVQINKAAYDKLPELYRQAIQAAAFKADTITLARYDKLNPAALKKIEASGKIKILPYPDDILNKAHDAAFSLYGELAGADPDFKALFDSWSEFRSGSAKWFTLAEAAMIRFNGSRV